MKDLGLFVLLSCASCLPAAAEDRLVAHWSFDGDATDSSGNGLHGQSHAVRFVLSRVNGRSRKVAEFNGRDAWIEVADCEQLKPGTGEFTISAWVHTQNPLDDAIGDLVSKYDGKTRTGAVWNIKQNLGGTTSAANLRNVQFGIDAGTEPIWQDCGRPGNAVLVYALAVHKGALFAGTCVADSEGAGHVFRYAGNQRWIDCGAPDLCNAVSALATYKDRLYAAVSKYRLRGSSLAESENPHLGGKIYRYEGGTNWTPVGTLPDVEAINALAVFQGKLHATSMYAPAGLFRYEGGTTWTDCGSPQGKRVEALCVYNGQLFAGGYDEGAVYRYDGRSWNHCGVLGENTQTYGFAVHAGNLYVGTWRSGRVYRYVKDNEWKDVGRLGEELEVMGMAVYNGKMYAGTLPLAEVYRFDMPGNWKKVGRVDRTPNVKYRRAWSMAVYDGKLFVGTLPSGHVWSMTAGPCVTYDQALPSGWVHMAAVKKQGRLLLYLNGKEVSHSSEFQADQFNLDNDQPLKIGFGPHDYFHGLLSDLRIHAKAFSESEVRELMK